MLYGDGFVRRGSFVLERSFCRVAAGDGLVRSPPQRPSQPKLPLALRPAHRQDRARRTSGTVSGISSGGGSRSPFYPRHLLLTAGGQARGDRVGVGQEAQGDVAVPEASHFLTS